LFHQISNEKVKKMTLNKSKFLKLRRPETRQRQFSRPLAKAMAVQASGRPWKSFPEFQSPGFRLFSERFYLVRRCLRLRRSLLRCWINNPQGCLRIVRQFITIQNLTTRTGMHIILIKMGRTDDARPGLTLISSGVRHAKTEDTPSGNRNNPGI